MHQHNDDIFGDHARYAAIQALAKLGDRAQAALPALERLLQECDRTAGEYLKTEAREAIGAIKQTGD